MKIISINAGSSSLKFQMYEMPEELVLISGNFERIGIADSHYTLKIGESTIKKEMDLPNHQTAVEILVKELMENNIIDSLDEIKGLGHRVVHGGDKYSESIIINNTILEEIKELSPLAPLHNPANIMGIESFVSIIPDSINIACFDTAFHQTLKEDRYRYAVPNYWYNDYSVRKFGFHGTSHKYISLRASEILNRSDINIIVCHLGNGASLSAIKSGECIDTSMGFTPNAGIIMGTRSGDIDYSILPYMIEKSGKTLEELDNELNKKSGMLGLSELSNDFRDLHAESDNEKVVLAFQLFINAIVDYIAKYYVQLEHVDAICFTAGIGENDSIVRKKVIDALSCLGVKLDEDVNAKTIFGVEGLITSSSSSIPCYVIPTNEELMIARDTYNLIK